MRHRPVDRIIVQHIGRIPRRPRHRLPRLDLPDPVRGRQQPRPEGDAAAFERRAQVDRADHVVELRVGRKLDDVAAQFARGQLLAAFAPLGTLGAEVRALRIAAVRARGTVEDRQQFAGGTDQRRLARAFGAGQQHAAHARIDRRERQCEFWFFLRDDGDERKRNIRGANGIWHTLCVCVRGAAFIFAAAAT